jgi:two-component system nitrogen regulation sensor histidine kinase GlnL
MIPAEFVIEHLVTPLVVLDAGGVVRAANPAFVGWIGLSARRLVEQPVAALGADGDLAALVERAREARALVRMRRVRLAPTPEHERFADASAAPVLDGEALVGVLLEFRPVEEFPGEDPAASVPGALHEALKGLAHEIRNPLAGLRGAAQLLAKRVADPDAVRYLEVISAESDRLATLVERLLNPQPPAPLAPTNVHAVLERVRLLAEAEAGWAIVIQRDYDPSLPAIAGDADRLAQALWNLVRNALQAEASEVRLRTRAEHNVAIGERLHRLVLRIDVDDNGRGVPETIAERVFLPLVSGRADGTGLGLTLAQEVAREHGGSLTFRSRPGHTVFTMLLPLADDGPAATDVGPA